MIDRPTGKDIDQPLEFSEWALLIVFGFALYGLVLAEIALLRLVWP